MIKSTFSTLWAKKLGTFYVKREVINLSKFKCLYLCPEGA